MLINVAIVASFGLLVCLYGLFVEYQLRKNREYKAVCDLSDHVSCTKPMLSPWSHILGIPNTYIGMIFYLSMIVLSLAEFAYVAFIAAIGSVIASLFLAYILYVKIKSFCLICTAIYGINLLLLIVTYRYL